MLVLMMLSVLESWLLVMLLEGAMVDRGAFVEAFWHHL